MGIVGAKNLPPTLAPGILELTDQPRRVFEFDAFVAAPAAVLPAQRFPQHGVDQ